MANSNGVNGKQALLKSIGMTNRYAIPMLFWIDIIFSFTAISL
ncbi:hypothetical protein [Mesobacillus zeae]|nr:hypothetical protein [Mesobacillus zeae]